MGKKKNAEVVAAMDNEYTKKKYSDFQKQQKQLIFRRRRLAIIFFIAFVMFGVVGVNLMRDYNKLGEFKEQLAQEETTSKKIDDKLTKLEKEVALLQDEDYVAKLARYRFDMSKDGEQIYRIPALDTAGKE